MKRFLALSVATLAFAGVAGFAWTTGGDDPAPPSQVVSSYAVGADPQRMVAAATDVLIVQIVESHDEMVSPDGPAGPELTDQVQTWRVGEALKGELHPGDRVPVRATVKGVSKNDITGAREVVEYPRPPARANGEYVLFLRSFVDAKGARVYGLAGRPGMGELVGGVVRLWSAPGFPEGASEVALDRVRELIATPPVVAVVPNGANSEVRTAARTAALKALDTLLAELPAIKDSAGLNARIAGLGLDTAFKDEPAACVKSEARIRERTSLAFSLGCAAR